MTVNGLPVKRSVIFKSQSDPTFDMKPEYIGIHSHNVFTNPSGLIVHKKIRKFAENKQTDKQTDREFKT